VGSLKTQTYEGGLVNLISRYFGVGNVDNSQLIMPLLT
jgi:hypothetical protein